MPAATVSERPRLLVPGDRVAIIAPSSPFDEDAYHAGAEWLRTRYAVTAREEFSHQRLAEEPATAGNHDSHAGD